MILVPPSLSIGEWLVVLFGRKPSLRRLRRKPRIHIALSRRISPIRNSYKQSLLLWPLFCYIVQRTSAPHKQSPAADTTSSSPDSVPYLQLHIFVQARPPSLRLASKPVAFISIRVDDWFSPFHPTQTHYHLEKPLYLQDARHTRKTRRPPPRPTYWLPKARPLLRIDLRPATISAGRRRQYQTHESCDSLHCM